jgi:hypothetical protein
MYKFVALTLLATACAAGAQTGAESDPAKQPSTTSGKDKPASAPTEKIQVAPDAPIITVHGLCPDKPAGTDPKSPECETIVTRAQFEHMVEMLAPNIPPSARQQLAGDYTRMLVLSDEARKRGLDKTERYNEILAFMKMRILQQELLSNVQEKAKPSAAEVQKYYDDNKDKYEELTLKRVFVPRNSPAADLQTPGANKTDDQLQAEGEKTRARLAAGEDFDKVQKEVYEAAGYKTPPPPTSIPNWRQDAVPAQQKSLFQLNRGDLSKVIVEAPGAYIYKVEAKEITPFSQVKPEIESQLQNQHVQQQMEALTNSIKPDINQAYFRGMQHGDREVHALTPSSTQPTGGPSSTPKK